MQRINYFLQKINQFIALKLSITIDNSDINPVKRSINQFMFKGSLYTNISIYPRLIIEFREMDGEKKVFSTNNYVSLSPLTAFRFCRVGRELLQRFMIKDLFIYQGKRLVLNQDLAAKLSKPFPADGKKIMFRPIVVQDYTRGIECEGVCMMINEMSNFATMTFEEFTFLLDTIRKLDFNSMGLELLKLYYKNTPGSQKNQ